VEHRFVDDATFDTLVRQGFFLASAALLGLPYRYGLPTIAIPAPGDGTVADAVMLRAPFWRSSPSSSRTI
jgi:putative lipase involved disintegration of autophagic bodies